MPATTVPARPNERAKPTSPSAKETSLPDRAGETPPVALCDRDRLLAALASRPPMDKETGEQLLRDIQEAREASINDTFDLLEQL